MAQSETIFYPMDDIRTAAAKILVKSDLALQSHEAAWSKIQSYVESFPGFMQGPIMDVISPYERRLRASYQWQKDFASTLFDVVNEMEATDNDVANSFKSIPDNHPRGFRRFV